MTLSTDDLPAAIAQLQAAGVSRDKIEEFSMSDTDGKPARGVCFQDPEGRLVMMVLKNP